MLRYSFKRLMLLTLIGGLLFANAALFPSRSAFAAPTAGTLTVNSTADTNASDSVLTLREALLIARGGTAANGVNRALTSGEKAQLAGSTFSGSTIIGGCGGGYADTINFSGIGTFITITLATSLPPIDDTQPTTIDGTGTYPAIDAHYFANYGFDVVSNGNTLQRIGVTSAWISDFFIEGDNNTLYDVWAWRGGTSGVIISGSYNTLDASRIGVDNVLATSCGPLATNPGNSYYGVYITGAAQHATVKNSFLGCSAGNGVSIASLSIVATYHTIGPDNRIGVNLFGAGNLGNGGNGVEVLNQNNVVMSNTIGYNGYDGVEIGGGDGNWNYLGGNTIRSNSKAGIELHAWASNNTIGKLSLLGGIVSNTISGNLGHGILITDTTTPPGFNIIIGNQIGVSADGLTAAGNGGDGILVYGGHDTYIGGGGTQRNIISGNAFSGVNLDGGAYNSHVINNLIGINAGGAARSNGADGVVLQGGAHDNVIGAAGAGNTLQRNTGSGVLLLDAGTTNNYIEYNSIISNTVAGVALRSGAAANRVRTNLIRLNGNAGVLIDGGANNNRIGEYGNRAYGNVIGANATDGIYIGGATTHSNAVLGNLIGVNAAGNVADPNLHTGIALDGGANNNQIGEYTTERNVIAGNAWDGVLMINGAHDNFVWGNDIGTNRDYPPAANRQPDRPDRPTGGGGEYLHLPNGGGVTIIGSYTNTLGGSIGATAVDNFINHNIHTGVYLAGGSQHNVIGSNTVRANGDYGVLFDGGNTAYNTISRTQIYQNGVLNGLDGLGERNSAGFNVWTEVGIHDNGGLGIDKSASNDGQNIVNAPNNFGIDSINRATSVVQGHADASVLGTVKIELYRVAPDPSGFGEGSIFVGATTTDTSGNWTITDTLPAMLGVDGGGGGGWKCYTALVTESQFIIPFSSSEFSANTCRVFLPLTVKNP